MLVITKSSLLRVVPDLSRAAAHFEALVPEVVEQVKTEFPAVTKLPATTPS